MTIHSSGMQHTLYMVECFCQASHSTLPSQILVNFSMIQNHTHGFMAGSWCCHSLQKMRPTWFLSIQAVPFQAHVKYLDYHARTIQILRPRNWVPTSIPKKLQLME